MTTTTTSPAGVESVQMVEPVELRFPFWRYFEVPLLDAYELFRAAYARLGGLGRTVRGPVMSATPGKVVVDGTALVGGGPAFVLRFLQARDPDWVGVPFFARADPHAVWFDELVPAAGDGWFFLRERSGCDA